MEKFFKGEKKDLEDEEENSVHEEVKVEINEEVKLDISDKKGSTLGKFDCLTLFKGI